MHELSVAQSILDIAVRYADEADHITDIDVVVGQLSSYIDDAIQFYWDIISEGTIAKGATLHFTRVPARVTCMDCGAESPLPEDIYRCPACGGENARITSGEEFYVDSIDVTKDKNECQLNMSL